MLARALWQFIESEIYKQGPKKSAWPQITSHWDAPIMAVWNVRCRVVALLQLLRYWEQSNIYKVTMDWVKSRRPGIDITK